MQRRKMVLAFLAGAAALPGGAVWASGDAAQGKAMVIEHCTACHLVPGHRRPHGVAELGAPPFAVMARSPRAYPAARVRAFLRRPHWPMSRFILSARDIDDFMAYLGALRSTAKEE